MKRSRVINLSPSSIVIEDLGVHLASRGSFAIVDSEAAQKSRSLQALKGRVKLEPFTETKSMPFWPFKSKPKKEKVENNELKTMLSELDKKTELLLKLTLAQGQSQESAKILEAIQNLPISSAISASKVPLLPESPMFIPSQILPKDVDSNINAKEKTVEIQDLKASLEALKKARKK